MTSSPKVLVIGLDCAPPGLIFDLWRPHLPTLSGLIEKGCYGPLRSSDPPITIPAWSSMLSGKNPAELGFYGFKNRKGNAYFEKDLVTSQAVKTRRVWDILGDHGKQSILLGVPQTFPAYPIQGAMVADFLAPGLDSPCVYPESLKTELQSLCPNYQFDVADFRTGRKKEILESLHQSTRDHFKFFKYLLKTRPWDFAMLVEIGTDRLQHCFWADWDTSHPLHDPASPFKNAMLDYYQQVDKEIAALLEKAGPDTFVFVVSDHGAKPMRGAIAINEWLLGKGYLRLKSKPAEPASIEKCDVDWENTLAWGVGGYYGRIYLNVAGREARGKLAPADYETFRKKLAGEIEAIRGLGEKTLVNRVHTPESLYGVRLPNAPDLMVYFDDLYYRCLSSVGSGRIVSVENDTGPDGANHDYEGIFIAKGPGIQPKKEPMQNLHLQDFARTVLALYGIPQTGRAHGKSIL